VDSTGVIRLTLHRGLAFDVDFGLEGVPALTTDVAPPLGEARGPDSELLLVAAVANCLAGSLAFALRKYRNDPVGLSATASAALARNELGRLRIQAIRVEMHLASPAADFRLLDRALAQYEDYCTVTQSVKAAIAVEVRVFDSEGVLLAGREARSA
jgi:organic hydroperoxide reductase OsmC/OhrA